jgi:hypothetical protein
MVLPLNQVSIQEPAKWAQGDPVVVLANGFFAGVILCGASSPDIDLSVFPIMPPVDPACPNAADPPAKSRPTDRASLIALPMQVFPNSSSCSR